MITWIGIKGFVTGETRRRVEREAEQNRKQEIEDLELAHQTHLSKNEYLRLASGPFDSVGIILARNYNIPDEAIQVLVKHSNLRIRAAVTENLNISQENLRILASDPDENVSAKAKEVLFERFGQEGINPSSFYFLNWWCVSVAHEST